MNDYGALASKYLAHEPRILREIQEVLDVEVVPGEIAGLPYVGSIATATNKGVLAHPLLRSRTRFDRRRIKSTGGRRDSQWRN